MLATLCFSLLPALALAQGGPPMVTDDPGTPGDGHWEINLGSIGSHTTDTWLIALPDLDINYGLGERLQLKVDTPWNVLSTRTAGTPGAGYRWENHDLPRSGQVPSSSRDAASSAAAAARDTEREWSSGLGTTLFGIKWRFFDDEDAHLTSSIYPQLGLNLHPAAAARGVATPGRTIFLPWETAVHLGPVDADVEFGRLLAQQGPDQWTGGLVLAHEFTEGLECMIEARHLAGGGTSSTLYNLGSRWEISKYASLMGAVGHEVAPSGPDRTILLYYLGLQLRL